jgi:cytochrome c oxidase subunit 1
VPSPAPHHTFQTPPVIGPGDLAHGDFEHLDYDDSSAHADTARQSNVREA